MADNPIIVYRPTLVIQELDEDGDPSGAPVDVSCDIVSAELTPEVPIQTVTTFCGTFQTPGDLEVSCTLEVAINDETLARWAPLVGAPVELHLQDKGTDSTMRVFTSFVSFNPGLYGPDQPGEARSYSFDMPVTSEVTSTAAS
jgi:hypothetical protein